MLRDAEAFAAFISNIEIQDNVGGDEAEDILGGLKVVIEKLSWPSDGTKASVLHLIDLYIDTCGYMNGERA